MDLDESYYMIGTKNHNKVKLSGGEAVCDTGERLFGVRISGEFALVSLFLFAEEAKNREKIRLPRAVAA